MSNKSIITFLEMMPIIVCTILFSGPTNLFNCCLFLHSFFFTQDPERKCIYAHLRLLRANAPRKWFFFLKKTTLYSAYYSWRSTEISARYCSVALLGALKPCGLAGGPGVRRNAALRTFLVLG